MARKLQPDEARIFSEALEASNLPTSTHPESDARLLEQLLSDLDTNDEPAMTIEDWFLQKPKRLPTE